MKKLSKEELKELYKKYSSKNLNMSLDEQLYEMFKIVKESDNAKELALDPRYTTRYGWAGFSGFEYTFKCVLAIIFTCYLLEGKMKEKKIWLHTSIFLSCRT